MVATTCRWTFERCDVQRCDVGRCGLHASARQALHPRPGRGLGENLAAFSRPMIGHRGEAFKKLYARIHPRLQELFGTKQPVFLSTSSPGA